MDGKDIVEQVPVDVPEKLAGSIVTLEVTAGDSAKLDAAPPVDLPSLMAAFRKLLPGNVWAATLYPADEGVSLDGKTFGAAGQLTVQENGATRPARADEYKHIRWEFKDSLQPGATALARFRAVLN